MWQACWIVVKPGTTRGAEAAGQPTPEQIVWLGTEWWDGAVIQTETPVAGVTATRVRPFIVTMPRTAAGRDGSKTAPRERRWELGGAMCATRREQSRQCQRGLRTGQKPTASTDRGCKRLCGRSAWSQRRQRLQGRYILIVCIIPRIKSVAAMVRRGSV